MPAQTLGLGSENKLDVKSANIIKRTGVYISHIGWGWCNWCGTWCGLWTFFTSKTWTTTTFWFINFQIYTCVVFSTYYAK